MDRYASELSWIGTQRERMCRLVTEWASINTGSHNLSGLAACARRVAQDFACLEGESVCVDLPPHQVVNPVGELVSHPLGQALRICKRPEAPLRVFLGIHMDTVFAPEHPFQTVTTPSPNVMQGPGVADAKGGMAVLLIALEALERSEWAEQLGWEILLNPDEVLTDFAHEPLPPRGKLGTVGLWCALHGEAILQAGMHHLECQFDFDRLSQELEATAGIHIMPPFTNLPYLRQAFTEGERWPVSEERLKALLGRGQITAEQADRFRREGALGSHLENLQRDQGFKGFNQEGVSRIIVQTDPRKYSDIMSH